MNKPDSRTAPALLAEITTRDPRHDILIDGERRWSYAAFSTDVMRVAQALFASGVRHGDRVGILAGNRAEWLLAYFAGMSLGAITVGLNTWSTARELAYQLEHAAVKFLFVEPRFRQRDFVDLLAEAREYHLTIRVIRAMTAQCALRFQSSYLGLRDKRPNM